MRYGRRSANVMGSEIGGLTSLISFEVSTATPWTTIGIGGVSIACFVVSPAEAYRTVNGGTTCIPESKAVRMKVADSRTAPPAEFFMCASCRPEHGGTTCVAETQAGRRQGADSRTALPADFFMGASRRAVNGGTTCIPESKAVRMKVA